MRRVKTVVPVHICKFRCLSYMHDKGYIGPNHYMKASEVAPAIWPNVAFTGQGAGAAASRILKVLNTEGLVRWNRSGDDWGYSLTPAGAMGLEQGAFPA